MRRCLKKAKSAAFDVIISMGKTTSARGVDKWNRLDGMDEDDGHEPAADGPYSHYFVLILHLISP